MSSAVRQSLMNGNVNILDSDTGTKHRTSIRLEKVEWDALRKICAINRISIHQFCTFADQSPRRKEHSRTSRIRCAVLQYCLDNGDMFDLSKKVEQQYWQR